MSEPIIHNDNLTLPAMAGAVVLCVLFGANAVAIKISLTGLGTLTTAGLRFSLAALTLLVWARATGQKVFPPRNQIYKLVIITAVFLVQLGMFYVGISRSNASRATLLVNLMPFFILFLAHVFIPGDSITRRKLLGMVLGFAGLAFVFMDKKSVTAGLRGGDMIVLASAFIWACNTVYTKRIIDSFETIQITIFPMLWCGPLYLILGFFLDEAMIFDLSPPVLLSMFYQSIVTASFGFIAWNGLLKKYGATALHSFVFIMPISGVLLGGFVLGEPITANLLLAMVLVAVGILIVHFKAKEPPPLSSLRRGI